MFNSVVFSMFRSALGFLWKEWCWSWNSSTLSTSWEELTHWKKLWCWEGLRAGGEGDDREWGGWVASLTHWTCVWVNSGSWWWTGKPGVLQFMGSQRLGHNWATELNWTELIHYKMITMLILDIMCHHRKILHSYWLYSYAVHFIPLTHLFCNQKFFNS